MRRIHCLFGTIALFMLLCSGQAWAGDVWPTPQNSSLWAVVDLPSGRDLGPTTALLDRIHPGTAAEIPNAIGNFLRNRLGVKSLDGVNLDRPIRLAILDPDLHKTPSVALVQVDNARSLRRGVARTQRAILRDGRALLGAGDARRVAGAYLLGAAQNVPPASTLRIVVFGPPLAARQQARWASTRQYMATMLTRNAPAMTLARMGLDGMEAMTKEIQQIEIRFLIQQIGAQIIVGADTDITPIPHSHIVQFAAAQRPSTFALLNQLPALRDPFLLGAGRVVAGPLQPYLQTIAEQIGAAFWGPDVVAQVRPHLRDMVSRFTGEAANATTLTLIPLTFESHYLSVVDDTKRAWHALRGMRETLSGRRPHSSLFGIAPQTTFRADAFTHRGVPVAEEVTKLVGISRLLGPLAGLAAQSASTTYYAAFDTLWTSVTGSRDAMRAAIDAARGTTSGLTLPPRVRSVRDFAAARRDSGLVTIESAPLALALKTVGASMPTGSLTRPFTIATTLGFVGGTPRFFLGAAF